MSTVERESHISHRQTIFQLPTRMPLPHPHPRIEPSKIVELCYTLMDVAKAVDIRDLADGEYESGNETLEQGIDRQNDYLLDQVGCNRAGFRLLEIGCGYGRLLRKAQDRGRVAVGVNISAEQVKYCNDRGSQVYCCNYRDLLTSPAWHGQFDGVIANGSLEHWVQPEDVQAGKMDDIYTESFHIAHKMIDPDATAARYVTTALHVPEKLNAIDLVTPWYRFPRGSAERQFSLLHQWFGGYYPIFGQLAECSQPYFSLDEETDGTLGYKIASEKRMQRMIRGLYSNPKLVWGITKSLVRHPWTTATLLQCYFIDQAWDWQFRGEVPPTTLLRQTWKWNSNAC